MEKGGHHHGLPNPAPRQWKQLRSLGLKERRFETLDQLTQVLKDALDYWNQHCHPYSWKKRPQEQFTILGGFGAELRHDNLAI